MKPLSIRQRLVKRWEKNASVKRLRVYTSSHRFAQTYRWTGFTILVLTSAVWATLAAKLQATNADQLVNADLLKNSDTFIGASFPGQHSFLFKWPIFWIIKLAHYSDFAYIATTVATVLLTVSIFAYILHKIERRPLHFGTLCLAAASLLLLVPTVPYSGALLPVSMGMVTTRNLEYVFYIVSLFLILRAPRIRSLNFIGGVLGLSLLIASDKLFLAQSLGGAVILIIAYSKSAKVEVISRAYNWFVASVLAAILAALTLTTITALGLTNITSQGAGPYGLVSSPKDVALGVIYALAGLFTNMGANPAYDAVEVKTAAHKASTHLLSLAGPGIIINFLLTLLALWWTYRFVRRTMTTKPRKSLKVDSHKLLGLALLSSTVVALGVFVITKHYYAVDARYETIAFFALLVTAANWLSVKRRLRSEQLVLAGGLLLVICCLSSVSIFARQAADNKALQTVNDRNQIVAQALAAHHVDLLVGDYWRVIPTGHIAKQKFNVMPLANCTNPRTTLTSTEWQPDLHHTSFAYLLTVKGSLTDFPSCNLNEILGKYGRPNASYLVSGTFANPAELLLFYDRGTTLPSSHLTQRFGVASILPTALRDLPHTDCSGPTTMNIVAHQDDDLLFLSPDLLHDIHAQKCIRTVYVTAGDAGNGEPFWLEREQGSEAAYSQMLGTNDLWIQRSVIIAPGEYATIASPRSNPSVSLIFLHLPDGGLYGDGFPASNHESLSKLASANATVTSVDKQSTYTQQSLTDALGALMEAYAPTEIHTQSTLSSSVFPDHSDHMTVGRLVIQAHDKYQQQVGSDFPIPLTFYRGYSIHEFAANVSGEDYQQKEAAFLMYAKFDGTVCHTDEQCRQTPTYGSYIERQYPEQQ